MPSEIGRLQPGAPDPQMKAALSACIAEQVRAGRTHQEAREMCEAMIREQMGEGMEPRLPEPPRLQ